MILTKSLPFDFLIFSDFSDRNNSEIYPLLTYNSNNVPLKYQNISTMQKDHNRIELRKVIPIITTGLIVSIHPHFDINDLLIGKTINRSEPHSEEPFSPDYLELNRDKVTAAASGVSTAIIFGENSFE